MNSVLQTNKMEGKRKMTPIKTPRKIKLHRVSSPRKKNPASNIQTGKSSKSVAYAANCVANYEYKKAFTYLYNNFPGARRAFMHVLDLNIRRGVSAFLKDENTVLRRECNMETLQSFSWHDVSKDLKKHIPLLYTTLLSTVTSNRRRDVIPGTGFAASVLLHLRSPMKIKMVQSMHALEIWRCGAHRKLFKHFQKLAVCASNSTALRLVSKIRGDSDSELLQMKRDIEKQMTEGFIDPPEDLDSESEPEESTETVGLNASLSGIEELDSNESAELSNQPETEEESSVDIPDVEDEEEEHEHCPGFTLTWDNVGKMVKASRQSIDKQNKMMLWALSYSSENRIPTAHFTEDTTIDAAEIGLENFLPNPEDEKEIKERMITIVSRFIVSEIPFFNDNFQGCTTKHIRHEYWRESSKKSKVINLGVCQENPSTTAGTIKILENLQQYTPNTDNQAFPILVFGDGLSCERHNDAHMARSNGATVFDKLQTLQPQVQEFHKRMLLMQDLMDIFYKGTSAAEKGTLFHLKNVFGRRNVTHNINETFNHAADFVKFVTVGYTVLATLNVLGMKKLSDSIEIPETKPEKEQFLRETAERVVDLCWQSSDIKEVFEEGHSDNFDYCSCKEDIDDAMVECSGVHCPGNNWFHLTCLGIEEEDIPDGEFFCSAECEERKAYRFCCHKNLGDDVPMVGCDNPRCLKEWFHLKCVKLKSVPRGKWFCSKTCRSAAANNDTQEEKDDHVFKYVTALLFLGLMDQVRHDAVRENDGKAMMSHWRHDMVQFFNRQHPKYLLLGHILLAGVAGWLPKRLRMDSIWNRTVNLVGGPGRNLEGDIVNEFLNKEFKESLKEAGGNITEETVNRHSQMAGSLGKTLDAIFLESAGSNTTVLDRKPKAALGEDLKLFIRLLQPEKLFIVVPGREFKSFQMFNFQGKPKNPKTLSDRLKHLTKRLDKIRRCCED